MKLNYTRAILIFLIGFIISFIVGVIFDDGGIATMTAVCYIGAIIAGSDSRKS